MRRIWVENFDIVAFSSGITMPLDFNASVDGRAVTAEYDLRKHAAKPVHRTTQKIPAVSKLCALRGDKPLVLRQCQKFWDTVLA
jgi:hypothetical protein